MSGKSGVFICPSCEAVVRSEKSLEEGIVCGECQHEFGKPETAAAGSQAGGKAIKVVPRGATKSKNSNVMRNLTAKKAPPVVSIGAVVTSAINAKSLQEAADEMSGTEGDDEMMMADGSRRIRRRKKRPKKEKNKGLILFLAGWLSVIAIIFTLFKLGQDDEKTTKDEESDLTEDARKVEVWRRFKDPVRGEFIKFMTHPTNEGREQFIADSANLSLQFGRHYRARPFPKPVYFSGPGLPIALVGGNVLAFSEEDYAIETIWQDKDGNKLGAVHIWDRDAWRIDWENFAPYSTESWSKFRAELGSESGEFRLLVRKRRTADEAEKFYLSFYRPPEFLEKDNEYLDTESPEVEVKTDSDLGREFLKLWTNHLAGKVPYGSNLGKVLDPGNYLRITVELAWEKNEHDESIMVLKDIIGVAWFGGALQQLHRKALKDATNEAESKLSEDTHTKVSD